MMNSDYLDNEQPEDKLIGKLEKDEETGCSYRMVNGRKIWQLEEKDQHHIDMNVIINRCRASGLSPGEYIKQQYE